MFVQTKIKAVFSSLFESIIPLRGRAQSAVIAKAHRIGPSRVILKIELNNSFNGLRVDHIAIEKAQLRFDLNAVKNETIAISLVAANDEFALLDQTLREHRATLKVQPVTNQLTLTFRTSNNDVYLSQKINIE